jgi:hypothetical protein
MKSQSIANPMPFIFATSLFLILIAVFIAISQFGRVSPTQISATSFNQDISLAQSPGYSPASPVREKTNMLMFSIGAMTVLVVIFSAVLSVLLNKRHTQRMLVIDAAQRLSADVTAYKNGMRVSLDPHTERCIRDYSNANWSNRRNKPSLTAWNRR